MKEDTKDFVKGFATGVLIVLIVVLSAIGFIKVIKC